MFGAGVERVMEWLHTHDPQAFKDFADTFTSVTLPIDPTNPVGWLPDAFLPLAEVAANYNSFYKGPIDPQREDRLLPEDRFGPKTTETAKAIGKVTNSSPRKVEHLIRGYGAGLAMHAMRLMDFIGGADLVESKWTPGEIIPGASAFTGSRPICQCRLRG